MKQMILFFIKYWAVPWVMDKFSQMGYGLKPSHILAS